MAQRYIKIAICNIYILIIAEERTHNTVGYAIFGQVSTVDVAVQWADGACIGCAPYLEQPPELYAVTVEGGCERRCYRQVPCALSQGHAPP